ncbi:MAG TPA: thioesterase family protein [Acidobacteriota bacterium]|nr:thioesterase family protein [Acidobacteriota bacterium]
MSRPFRYFLRVRFHECDAQKVVFNAIYGTYVDIAVLEFLRAIGLGEAVTGQFDYQLVKQTVEWKAPARFDQVLEISVWAKHLGNTSFTLATEFRLAGQSHINVTAETVYVLVDAQTLSKTPLPPHFRHTLEVGGWGLWVDHASCTVHRGEPLEFQPSENQKNEELQ